jgi:hypothetical protein
MFSEDLFVLTPPKADLLPRLGYLLCPQCLLLLPIFVLWDIFRPRRSGSALLLCLPWRRNYSHQVRNHEFGL